MAVFGIFLCQNRMFSAISNKPLTGSFPYFGIWKNRYQAWCPPFWSFWEIQNGRLIAVFHVFLWQNCMFNTKSEKNVCWIAFIFQNMKEWTQGMMSAIFEFRKNPKWPTYGLFSDTSRQSQHVLHLISDIMHWIVLSFRKSKSMDIRDDARHLNFLWNSKWLTLDPL